MCFKIMLVKNIKVYTITSHNRITQIDYYHSNLFQSNGIQTAFNQFVVISENSFKIKHKSNIHI